MIMVNPMIMIITMIMIKFPKFLRIIQHRIINHFSHFSYHRTPINLMNFRTRFNVTEIATEALIKFMKLVLCEVAGNDFDAFPNSLYLARKMLGLSDQFHSF